MDDPLLVRGRKPLRDRDGIGDRLAHRNAARLQSLAQRLSLEQLRDDERRIPVDANVVDGEDVRMVQSGGGAGFLLEAMKTIGVGREGGWQNLDRDVASQPRISAR